MGISSGMLPLSISNFVPQWYIVLTRLDGSNAAEPNASLFNDQAIPDQSDRRSTVPNAAVRAEPGPCFPSNDGVLITQV
ncbi:MAG: hypothetical protein V4568_01745 [Pseudomonadota bacterium]